MAFSKKFVDTPATDLSKGSMTKPKGSGKYDGEKTGAFGGYPRTKSPNGVAEKTREGADFDKSAVTPATGKDGER